MLIADFGMTSVLGRDIAQPHDSPESYWGNYLMVRAVFSLVSTLLCMAAAYWVRPNLFRILLVGALSLPFLSARFFEPLFQVYKRPWYSTYSSALYALCSLAFLLLTFHFAVSLPLVVLAFICANVAYAVFAYYLAQRSLKPRFVVTRTIIIKILKLAVPLGVSGLFTVVSSRVPIFMLAAMKSDYAVGIFSAAYRFFDLSAMAAVMIISPFVPIFSARAAGDRASLRSLAAMIVDLVGVVAFPVAIVTPLVSPFIVKAVFGVNFLPSAQVLNVLVWSGVIVFYSLLASALGISLGIVHYAYWNTAAAAALSIILNYAWIPRFGFVGSAWITVICEVFLAGVAFCFVTNLMGSIFRARHWIKIAVVNLVLAGLLHNGILEMNLFLKIGGSLAVYILLVILLKAVPGESIRLVAGGISRLKVKYAS